ncbi:MAG: arsenite methyltransferase [Candidatus Hydrogenedentes bacterium]|nr:arsenite methyltransferase [Candidatus Hydrogenedentota bacterium]
MSDAQAIRETVRAGYGAIAEGGGSCCGPATNCCGGVTADAATELAAAVGYDLEDLSALPEGANLGLSCGNPTALAALKAGEVVLDLGSGGGFDVFIAGRKVGPGGRAIGVDMTPAMLDRARKNIAGYRERTGLDNVEFRLGEIEHLPLPDESVDVVISNCVINLSPDKPQVWREIARVLKPGGRVAVSDIALLKPLPAEVVAMAEALIGCIAGAVTVAETARMAEAAGLERIALDPKSAYVDAMMDSVQDFSYREMMAHLPEGAKASDFVVSLGVSAVKPGGAEACCGPGCC